jgi:hypothetical protein
VRLGLPVLIQDNSQGLGVDAYLSLGFFTNDSASRTVGHGFLVERRWRRDGVSSTMLSLVKQSDLYDPDGVQRLRQLAGDSVVIVAFTSTLTTMYHSAPESLDRLGKVTAILHLDKLAEASDQPARILHAPGPMYQGDPQ